MDAQRFDTLTKTLSASGSRRGALAALLAGTLGLLGLPETTAGRMKQRHRQRHEQGRNTDQDKAAAEGPCGNGSGKANACTRHRQCCTGYCDKKRGRCRCRGLGKSCRESRNCCTTHGQPMTCQGGRCQTVCTPTSGCPACQTCQAGSCVPVADGDCCAGGLCVGGTCAQRATLAMCDGRCDSADLPATVACTGAGPAVRCPSCDGGCAANGCADGGARLQTPAGESFYCVTSVAPTSSPCQACPAGSPIPCPPTCTTPGALCTPCPAGEGCLLVACLEICTGE
jgi:hypothetical protein